MLTVGAILKNRRLEKGIGLEQVERITKIRRKFLEAIENNYFAKFSSQTILKGLIRNYSNYLGLPVNQIMAFYRRQSEEGTADILPRKNTISSGFRITPPVFTALMIVAFLSIFIGFLVFQYLSFVSAPPLEVDSPKENSVVETDQVDVVGKTDPEAYLTVNDQLVRTNEQGQFQIKLPLSAGLNVITLKATNKYQKTTTVTRHLRLEK